jgi:hypothetical protein
MVQSPDADQEESFIESPRKHEDRKTPLSQPQDLRPHEASIGSSSDGYLDSAPSESEVENIKNIDYISVKNYKVKKNSNAVAWRDLASHHFGSNDFPYLPLKPDRHNLPLWMDPYNHLQFRELSAGKGVGASCTWGQNSP